MPTYGSVTYGSSLYGETTGLQVFLWELIELVKQHLYTGSREEKNKLLANINSTTNTVTFEYALSSIQEQSRISVELEDMLVWTRTPGINQVIVERGQFGSTATAHNAGTIATINPKFSDQEILRAINSELRDLSSPANGLFRTHYTDLTFITSQIGYNIPSSNLTDVDNLLDVIYLPLSSTDREWRRVHNFELGRNLSSLANYASGFGLFVRDAIPTGSPIRVLWKAPFGRLTSLTENVVSVTGIPETAIDILELGAAIRVHAGSEIRRNFTHTQGDTRRAEEVPPGAVGRSLSNLAVLRDSRIRAEAARLNARYPRRLRRYWDIPN